MKPTNRSYIKSRIFIGLGSLILMFLVLVLSLKKDLLQTKTDLNQVAAKKTIIDPLALRWTFGNHEPLSMYRRAGNRVTGGVEGNALWLEDWYHWFDSDASTKLMQELGLNILHSRFYKGMGWNFESQDFPDVKKFVDNCHKHDIKVLAYVQFATFYYETMLEEIPDLAKWAALDENGRKLTWGNVYYRWLPCINSEDFEKYLKKVIHIALTEGGFDGIMFDNCGDVPICYCPRCIALFREYLSKTANPVKDFGIPAVNHVLPPVPRSEKAKYGEIQDPINQKWIQFRGERLTNLFHRLYLYAKSINPSAIVTGNLTNIRRSNTAGALSLNIPALKNCFDIFVSQSGNMPGINNGCVINRVREIKLAQALNTPILALCDGAGGTPEENYILTLTEDAVFGGIPTDRTIMKPDRDMVSAELLSARKPLLKRFNQMVKSRHKELSSPSYEPVRVLYSNESIMFSQKSYEAILSAEEILLRNHVPYGLLPVSADTSLTIPSDCEVLLICDQRCFADSQIDTLIQFAREGGRLIITGESGAYDQYYRQRPENPFIKKLKSDRNVIQRAEVDLAPIKSSGWTIKVTAPENDGRQLMADLSLLWSPLIKIKAPTTTFAEIKHDKKAFYIHLLNYDKKTFVKNAYIQFSTEKFNKAGSTFAAFMEDHPSMSSIDSQATDMAGWKVLNVSSFQNYALVTIKLKDGSE